MDEMGRACSMHGRDEKFLQYCWRILKVRNRLEDLGVNGMMMMMMMMIEWIFGKQSGRVWTGFIWLRIETSGGPL
jgi:hypothetical protein